MKAIGAACHSDSMRRNHCSAYEKTVRRRIGGADLEQLHVERADGAHVEEELARSEGVRLVLQDEDEQ